jgi:hypothetical protein
MSSIEKLLRILPPPLLPVDGLLDNFGALEQRLGRMPADYKEFIKRYGTGSIGRFIWILNANAHNSHLNLLQEMEPILGALRHLRRSGEPCPYRLYPESDGLLPYGKTDNGDVLYWLTVGKPERWPVVVNAAREPSYERFDCDMTGFLIGILTREIRSSIFPASFPSGLVTFEPFTSIR